MGEVVISREDDDSEELEETSFADFSLEKKLGKGGQGTIFEAKKKGNEEKIALKISNKTSRKSKEQFRQETAALTELNGSHPGIVKIIETGICKKKPFIALELINGENLENILNKYHQIQFGTHKQFMPVDYVLNVMSQLADALDFAHSKNVIHGDMKPANILITADDKVKITDFGLSKLNSADLKNSLSVSGEIAGTIQYMSPERQAGAELCVQDDIYSFGTILYRTLTNRLPLEDRFEFAPSQINKEVSEEIDELYKKCIAKSEKRYQNIKEVISDLQKSKKSLENRKSAAPGKVYRNLSKYDIMQFIKGCGHNILDRGKSIEIIKKGNQTITKGILYDKKKRVDLCIGALHIDNFELSKILIFEVFGEKYFSELKNIADKISNEYGFNINMTLSYDRPHEYSENKECPTRLNSFIGTFLDSGLFG